MSEICDFRGVTRRLPHCRPIERSDRREGNHNLPPRPIRCGARRGSGPEPSSYRKRIQGLVLGGVQGQSPWPCLKSVAENIVPNSYGRGDVPAENGRPRSRTPPAVRRPARSGNRAAAGSPGDTNSNTARAGDGPRQPSFGKDIRSPIFPLSGKQASKIGHFRAGEGGPSQGHAIELGEPP